MAMVIRARVFGYCMGVRRAMEMAFAEAAAASDGGSAVYTLGPLIHNPTALESLSAKGVRVLDESSLPDSLAGATVVIRAHGVAPDVAEEVKRRGARIVDATCPRVRLSQKKAEKYAKDGYTLFLAGEADHGEIIGIAGYAPGCVIVSSPEEARSKALSLRDAKSREKVALIGQTTIKSGEYADIASEIRAVFPSVEIFDGICPATMDRQAALRELCDQTDAVVVVGGKNSANTKRLYLSALEYGKPAVLVETAAEISEELGRFSTIGLTAGASTPDLVIDSVERKLRSLGPIPARR